MQRAGDFTPGQFARVEQGHWHQGLETSTLHGKTHKTKWEETGEPCKTCKGSGTVTGDIWPDNVDTWEVAPAVVLDHFGGAGTTGLVADQLGRDCILIDLKDEYGEMAQERILGSLGPMFTEVELVAV